MFGVQEASRRIVISQEINEHLANDIIHQIMDINEQDDIREDSIVGFRREPIYMYIHSGGGCVVSGNAIIGAMELSDTPIITYGMGIVGSMALGIFMKGDIRIAQRYARFMYHGLSYGATGYLQDHKEAQKECAVLQSMYDSLFADTKFDIGERELIRNRKENYFFSAKKAVELGVAHEMTEKPEVKIKLEEVDEEG
jgi:ATP-dependent Clp protease, protease subunit